MKIEEFNKAIQDAVSKLPPEFLDKLENVEFIVEEWPSRQQLTAAKLLHKRNALLFGLYQGIPQTRRAHYNLVFPDKISIFKGPIESVCKTDVEVRQKIFDVILHEIGHHFGMDEAKLKKIP
ncbi:MAG: metallopeptidase family protein [Actinobacteria bacterium]|nr:metallopeptidase family protein [Actinomycetota bacterium]